MIYNWPVTKKMDETWVLNNIGNYQSGSSKISVKENINFISNNETYSQFYYYWYNGGMIQYDGKDVCLLEIGKEDVDVNWTNDAYKTITFLEPPTGDLLTWLQQNGVKQ